MTISARRIRRIFLNQGRSRFWNTKSVLILLLGCVIGNLISEYYDYNSVKIIQNENHFLNQRIDIGQHNHSTDPNSKASGLYNKVKILCWVKTNPGNHKTRVVTILKTWGKRCNKILVISSESDKELPEIIPLPVSEGRDNLWSKTKEAFTYIYEYYLDEYDWFFGSDDDAYVIVENLRLLLYEHDPMAPIYFGYKFAPYVKQGYMSGGPGYVLSKEALRRFVEIAIPDPKLCSPRERGADDVEIGKCLENVNVVAGDSRYEDKRARFFLFGPEDHLLSEKIDPDYWYWKNMYYKTKDGLSCCSNYAIAFHYIGIEQMYVFDYLIYHAKPYGIKDKKNRYNGKKNIESILVKSSTDPKIKSSKTGMNSTFVEYLFG